MELIEKIPEINADQAVPDCVDLLIDILARTRDDTEREKIGQLGLPKLHSFAHAFIRHPHVTEFFFGQQNSDSPVCTKIATNIFRIFRNLCVNSPANQNRIRETAELCSDLVAFLLVTVPSQDILITLRSGVQFFGNFVTSNQTNAQFFWELGFPHFFARMIEANDRHLTEHTLMLLYNCVRQTPELRKQLVNDPFFKTLIGTLMSLHESHDQSFQWIYFILLSIFSDDMFEQAYSSLKSPGNIEREQELQLEILKILDAMVEKVAEELPRRAGRGDAPEDLPKLDEQYVITSNCCSFFVRELAQMYNKDFSRISKAAHAANLAAQGSSDASEGGMDRHSDANTSTGAQVAQSGANAGDTSAQAGANANEPPNHANAHNPDAQSSASAGVQAAQGMSTVLSTREYELIYFMLRVLGHVTSLVEECESTRMCKNGSDLRTNLGKEGLIALVIGTLRGAWELEQAAKARKDKGALFAPGYKRELMGLIANLTYNNKGNQDEVRELGGVELVLNHCNIDDTNPFIREWAIYAIKNLLEGNPENQEIVRGLKAEKVSDTHGVMQEMGIGAELVNGVLKFKQNVPPNLKDAKRSAKEDEGGSY